ncbi:MAG: 5'/3'-nucleotidase SurE [Flavobacteriales bacterium]|jgi:5'-nucleotidase|nr:5'/3'-nucleotidase SurE [Flavobacteriales bacterium]MBK6550905.1 5'/3'-nucleotidase SurE [Flavobacteriales bacterium]MBK6882463.1 5'/3'-nucleotidase SurE [Flavobacteriales bacterium]MBK7101326.1 5'/3'-nucleotidase SurE [Flavobacteriales bacterium]MBK7112033.1 5'/3'-nucleotidase SurE [Flavobacteriales bacterium]
MKEQPLILVTNDDGIFAPGIRTLVEEMKPFGRVLVVAPDKPQSAMGHAITIHSFLRLQSVHLMDGVEAWSCTGTPVDCVKLAIYKLLGGNKPDLLVSGVNHGANISINVLYSGTMSAAVEGAMENIPSIGFSLMDHSIEADFSQVRPVIRSVVGNVLNDGLTPGSCLNVNVPKANGEPLKGLRVCRQAKANWEDEFETRLDPGNKEYYWLRGEFRSEDQGEDTDVWAVDHHYVSIVPTQFDMTAHHAIAHLNTWDHALG